jgi:hypothetical protein
MRSDGRLEKRATVQVPVRLLTVENPRDPESATTLNISRFGARVFTNRRWLPGDQVDIASVSGEFRRPARVVYCHPVTGGHFCIGLEFGASVKNWQSAPMTSVA